MNVAVKPRPRPASDATRTFAEDVMAGLMAEPKRLPPKYFYDQRGSRLFEEITQLPEYYPTRTETAILQAHAAEIAKLIPADAAMVEFGAGSAAKARILLGAAGSRVSASQVSASQVSASQVSAYVPVDISSEFLSNEAQRLREDMPKLQVLPVAADFTRPFELPAGLGAKPRVGFFPGSTIGNFEPHEAHAFLRHAAALLGRDALLIIGVDLVKDPAILNAAYNDAAGVTAAFNLNLLERINRELDGEFKLEKFCHRAFYNREKQRVEMHLVSLARQKVRVMGKLIDFRRGETIHTENSYKYTVELFRSHARSAGWTPAAFWLDEHNYFSVHALVAAAPIKAVRSDARV
jgi:dimethylhistidine N-methyltransferase